MTYLNSITLVGFVGSDPEQRQAKGNGSKFTVLSVATQRSWKNADDEWSSKTEWHRVVVFRPLLAERVATTIKKAITYEELTISGKGKKAKTTSWTICAGVVRKLDRGEPEPQAPSAENGTNADSDSLKGPLLRRGAFFVPLQAASLTEKNRPRTILSGIADKLEKNSTTAMLLASMSALPGLSRPRRSTQESLSPSFAKSHSPAA
jgi:Single-strand binding protein family